MASKRGTKASAADEIDELFEGINDTPAAPKKSSGKTSASAKAGKPGDDILAELENELGEKAPSRPHTPRVREPAKPAKRTGTPNTDAPRQSLEETKPTTLPRRSAESNRASFTPSATSSDLQEAEKSKGTVEQEQQVAAASTGGGWWGGILLTASAAMKQAEAAVKEIQQNEEAKKWADQMRGNVGALRGLGKSRSSPIILKRSRDGIDRLGGRLGHSELEGGSASLFGSTTYYAFDHRCRRRVGPDQVAQFSLNLSTTSTFDHSVDCLQFACEQI